MNGHTYRREPVEWMGPPVRTGAYPITLPSGPSVRPMPLPKPPEVRPPYMRPIPAPAPTPPSPPPPPTPPTAGIVRRIEGLGEETTPGGSGSGGILNVISTIGTFVTNIADAIFGYKKEKARAEAEAARAAAGAQQTQTVIVVGAVIAFLIVIVLIVMVMGRR